MSLHRWIKSIAWTIGALGLLVPGAMAQNGPMQSAPAQPVPTQLSQIFSPYWNQLNESYADAEQTAARLVAEAPQAHAFAAAAKFTFFATERELNVAISNLRADIEASEEFQTALNDYRAASLRYEQAKRTALRELRENPQFAARSQLVDRLRDQIQDQHGSLNPDFRQVFAMAAMKLEQSRELTEAETIELAGNADVQMAREDMVAAYNNLVTQRKQLERVVRNDPNLIELRAAKSQALIAHVAAATYAEKLDFARDQALRFAVFNKVQDRYTPASGWWCSDWNNWRWNGWNPTIRSTYYPVGVPTIDMK